MSKRIGIISLGCAKNRVNTEQMMYLLTQAGYRVTGDTYGVDAVIVNTCGFIDSAKTEAIDVILELTDAKATGNIGAVIVAGCLAQRHKDDISKELLEVDAFIGTGSFDDIVSVVEKVFSQKRTACGDEESRSINSKAIGRTDIKTIIKPPVLSFGEINTPVSGTKRIISTSPVWTYLKIAEGCDNCCAYCTIPAIRGRLRSRPLEAVVNEAKDLSQAGYRELILVAQDSTAYGMDLYGKRSLTKLLQALGEIDELTWIRLLYMYPDGFTGELVDEIVNNDRIVKYLDIPIQHINDEILQKMNRRGSGNDIRKLFASLKERMENVVLRTSLITGLPGEGEKEFEELCDFLREMKIQRAGVFTYSPQEGTAAAAMRHPGRKTAQRRAQIIEKIQTQIMAEFNKSRIGTVQRVLIEGGAGTGDTLPARSYAEAPEADGYIAVRVSEYLKPHTFTNIELTDTVNGELLGEAIVKGRHG